MVNPFPDDPTSVAVIPTGVLPATGLVVTENVCDVELPAFTVTLGGTEAMLGVVLESDTTVSAAATALRVTVF